VPHCPREAFSRTHQRSIDRRVLVVDPALGELAVAHGVDEHALDLDAAERLACDDRAALGPAIVGDDATSRRCVRRVSSPSAARRHLPRVVARERVRAEPVQHDVVVIAVEHRREVAVAPCRGIALDHGTDLALARGRHAAGCGTPARQLYTPPVLRPADALVVERDELDRVELDDVEVGRQVEVARRDQRLALAVEERRVERLPAPEPVDQPCGSCGAGSIAGRIGKPTFWNARPIIDEQITSVVRPPPTSSAFRRRTAAGSAKREEVARQVEDVLHVVAQPSCATTSSRCGRGRSWSAARPADAEVHVGVLESGEAITPPSISASTIMCSASMP
jgi:hypothetical protein